MDVSKDLQAREEGPYQVDQPVSLSHTDPPSDRCSARLLCLPQERFQRLREIRDEVCGLPLQLDILLNFRRVHLVWAFAVLTRLGYHGGRMWC
jgi:hypothetical protein